MKKALLLTVLFGSSLVHAVNVTKFLQDNNINIFINQLTNNTDNEISISDKDNNQLVVIPPHSNVVWKQPIQQFPRVLPAGKKEYVAFSDRFILNNWHDMEGWQFDFNAVLKIKRNDITQLNLEIGRTRIRDGHFIVLLSASSPQVMDTYLIDITFGDPMDQSFVNITGYWSGR